MNPRPLPARALVVFSGKADLAWLRLLRPGFRHCFVLLEQEGVWVCVNPLAHWTSVEVWSPKPGTDLLAWLRCQEGLTVVETVAHRPPRRAAPLGLYSCVEAVKRVLGVHRRWVLTPGQLHDYLTGAGKYSLTAKNHKTNIRKSTPEPCPDQSCAPVGRPGFEGVWNKT
jgi:hypothetical protein